MMRGLLQRVPQYYERAEDGGAGFRDFESMDEIAETGEVLEEIDVVAEACFGRLGIPRPPEAKPALETSFVNGWEDLTLRKLLLTGFVKFALKGRFEIAPVAEREVSEIFDKVLEQLPSGARLVRDDLKAGFIAWIAGATGFEGREREVLKRFFAAGVKLLDEELGNIPSWEMLDPRYVSTLVFGAWPDRDER
jgi:hypothetical protein